MGWQEVRWLTAAVEMFSAGCVRRMLALTAAPLPAHTQWNHLCG